MVVIHPKMKLKPQYPGKVISARQNLPRNPLGGRGRLGGWGAVYESKRRLGLLRGTLVSLTSGRYQHLGKRHYRDSVAISWAAFSLLEKTVNSSGGSKNLEATLDHVLAQSRQGKKLDFRIRIFCAYVQGLSTRPTVTLKLLSSPGDCGTTVYTIMLPLEK